MQYQRYDQEIEKRLKEAGGTEPSETTLTMAHRFAKEGLDHAIEVMIERYLGTATEEALDTIAAIKLPSDNIYDSLMKRYRDIRDSYYIAMSHDVYYNLVRQSDRPPMSASSERTIEGRRVMMELGTVPVVTRSMPNGHVLALKKGWFEFSNWRSTNVRAITGLRSISPMPYSFDETATYPYDVGVSNATLIKVMRDKIHHYVFEGLEDD